MLLEMKVPSPGESISEVEIIEWLVTDGDYVEKDQSIAEIDSDKATLELPAEESGIIKILTKEGVTVAVGDVVCIIDTSAKKETKDNIVLEENKDLTSDVAPINKVKINKATPLASVIINKHDISAEDLTGSGEAGKITKNDVLDLINFGSSSGDRGQNRKKMSSLRRKIASRLVAVKNETAMLTTFNEIDMTSIFEIRNSYKEAFKEKHNVGLGFMSFFTKSCYRSHAGV